MPQKEERRPLAHCVIIVRKGCQGCSELIKKLRESKYQWIRQYVPIIDIDTARKYFEHLFNKCVKSRVDEYGFVWKYIETPVLICEDMDEPIVLTPQDDHLTEIFEMVRSKIILMEHVSGSQKYRGRVRTCGRGRKGEE